MTGGQLCLGEVHGVTVLCQWHGGNGVGDTLLSDFVSAFIIYVYGDVADMVLEHVCTLGVVVVDEAHVESGGTVRAIFLHHRAGSECHCHAHHDCGC